MRLEQLSKEISYALRHAPQEYGLILDEQGWVSIDLLVLALKGQGRFESLSIGDIEKMIENSSKKRHEIQGNRIRALYGHSISDKIIKESTKPPNILFHGTSHVFLDNIMQEGLMPKGRHYVHLSQDIETAFDVGKRRDDEPIILKINAEKAWEDEHEFYHGNENIWLADRIPPQYISRL